jgi:hypothetical protein
MYVGGMQVGEKEMVSCRTLFWLMRQGGGWCVGGGGDGVDVAKAAPLFQPNVHTTDASDDGHSENIKKSFYTRRS